jgi:hypothetical protein
LFHCVRRSAEVQAEGGNHTAALLSTNILPYAGRPGALGSLPPVRPVGAGAEALRWALEELRVAIFAPELGAQGAVSLPKVAAAVTALR